MLRFNPPLLAALLGVFALLHAPAAGASAPDKVTWTEISSAVLRENLELRLASQQIEASRADLQRAVLHPNPTVSLADSGWKGSQSPIGRAGDLIARIDQPIERGEKRLLRERQGAAALQVAQFDLLHWQRQILTRLAGALIDLDTTRRRLAAAQEIAAALERADTIARRRLGAGDLSEVGAGRVATDAIRARNDVSVARGDIFEALQALRVLLEPRAFEALQAREIDIDSLPGLAAPVAAAATDGMPDSRAADALSRSPELAGARQREEAARAALALATAQRTRDVTVGVQLERPSYSNVAVLGVFASFPLHVFNDFSADIRRASSDLQSARLETERLTVQLATERSRLAQAFANAREREERLRDQALPAAQRNAQTAEYAFQRGAASVLEVLDAQRTLRGIQIEVLAARADRLRAASSVALIDLAPDRSQPAAAPSPEPKP